MCKHLHSIIACHLLLHDRINALHSSADIFSHFPFKLVHSSSTFLGFFSLALAFSNHQTFYSIHVWALSRPLHNSNFLLREKCLDRLHCVTRSVHKYNWVIICSSQIRYSMFLPYLFAYSCVNFTV